MSGENRFKYFDYVCDANFAINLYGTPLMSCFIGFYHTNKDHVDHVGRRNYYKAVRPFIFFILVFVVDQDIVRYFRLLFLSNEVGSYEKINQINCVNVKASFT